MSLAGDIVTDYHIEQMNRLLAIYVESDNLTDDQKMILVDFVAQLKAIIE